MNGENEMKKIIVVLGVVVMGIVGMVGLSQHQSVVKTHDNTLTFVNTLGKEETLTGLEDYDVKQIEEDFSDTIDETEVIYVNNQYVEIQPSN